MTPPPHFDTPALRPMYRLQWEPAQSAWVLLYPEGLVKLNTSATEILRRCNGTTPLADLVADLEQQFGTPDLQADVVEFLAQARTRGWIA